MISKEKFQQSFGDTNGKLYDSFYQPLVNTLYEYSINTKLRIAYFLANIMHETGNLSNFTENLNYTSGSRLLHIYGSRFQKQYDAKGVFTGYEPPVERYLRNPEALASLVYADRYGNGNEKSKDGWKYRGRGTFQFTFKNNYKAYSDFKEVDFVKDPDKILEPEYLFDSAGYFWNVRGLNALADKNNGKGIRKRINGGYNGYEEVKKNFIKVTKILDAPELQR